MYGADGVTILPAAEAKIRKLRKLGFDGLPVCMAKTQDSLSDNPKLRGRPKGFTLTVRDVEIAAGAGFVVALTGEIVRMPGLPARPAAERIDLDDDGEIRGPDLMPCYRGPVRPRPEAQGGDAVTSDAPRPSADDAAARNGLPTRSRGPTGLRSAWRRRDARSPVGPRPWSRRRGRGRGGRAWSSSPPGRARRPGPAVDEDHRRERLDVERLLDRAGCSSLLLTSTV